MQLIAYYMFINANLFTLKLNKIKNLKIIYSLQIKLQNIIKAFLLIN